MVMWSHGRLLCSRRCLLCLSCPQASCFLLSAVVVWQLWGLLHARWHLLSLFPVSPARFPCLSFPYCASGSPVVFSSMGRVAGHGWSQGMVRARAWLEPGHGDGGWWGLGGKNDVMWHRCDMLSRGLGIADARARCQMWQLL